MSRTIVIETNVDTFFGKTLMLRGFAEFVAWKHIQNSSEYHHKNIVQDIIKYVRQKHFDTIVSISCKSILIRATLISCKVLLA